MIPLGKVEKMMIKAYTDAKCETAVGEYTFALNPETYRENYEIELEENQASGTSGTTQKYGGEKPQEWEFDILIDGTGVIKDASVLNVTLLGASEEKDVQAEVETLKSLVLNYNGDTHKSNYLVIAWGEKEDLFKGSLVSLDLNYKLFKSDGSPLRVIATMRLRKWVDEELRVLEEASSSPDITHQKTFTASDKLSLMSYKIYNDSKYYYDVAEANNLNTFRKISIGTKLNLPPLK